MKRRSDTDILQFIRELPGGNVPQYAKLLNTTAIRLNTLLHTSEGQKLVRKNLVVVAEKGLRPKWSSASSSRGCLRSKDVDQMVKDDTLPPFITKLLATVHPTYRDDSLNFLREALDQTANHRSFEEQMSQYMHQDKDRTDSLVQHEERILMLEREASTFEYVLAQANTLRDRVEELTGALKLSGPAPAPAPTPLKAKPKKMTAGAINDGQTTPLSATA